MSKNEKATIPIIGGAIVADSLKDTIPIIGGAIVGDSLGVVRKVLDPDKTTKSDTYEDELIKRWKDRVENPESVSETAARCAENTSGKNCSEDIAFVTPVTVAFPYVRAKLKFELKDDEVLDDFTLFFLKSIRDGASTSDISEITRFPEKVIIDEYEKLSEQGFTETETGCRLTELGERQILVYELMSKLHQNSIECSIDLFDGSLSFDDSSELLDEESIGGSIFRVGACKDIFHVCSANYALDEPELIAEMIKTSEPSLTDDEVNSFLDSIYVTALLSEDNKKSKLQKINTYFKLKQLSAVPRNGAEAGAVPVVIKAVRCEYAIHSRRFDGKEGCYAALQLINNQMPELLVPEAGGLLAEYKSFLKLSEKGLFTEISICGEDHSGLELHTGKLRGTVVTIEAVGSDDEEQCLRKLSRLTDNPDVYAVPSQKSELEYISYVPYSYFKVKE